MKISRTTNQFLNECQNFTKKKVSRIERLGSERLILTACGENRISNGNSDEEKIIKLIFSSN